MQYGTNKGIWERIKQISSKFKTLTSFFYSNENQSPTNYIYKINVSLAWRWVQPISEELLGKQGRLDFQESNTHHVTLIAEHPIAYFPWINKMRTQRLLFYP